MSYKNVSKIRINNRFNLLHDFNLILGISCKVVYKNACESELLIIERNVKYDK